MRPDAPSEAETGAGGSMTTRPPKSGGPKGRKPQAGKFDAGKFKPGKFQADGRARTGPRTSARDAAERAARNRGDDAGARDPWGAQGAAAAAPARPAKPRRDTAAPRGPLAAKPGSRPVCEWTRDELMEQATTAGWLDADLRLLIAEIDDANTRAAYMALAADDQLGLFEGVAI